jgi:hypothetical protein
MTMNEKVFLQIFGRLNGAVECGYFKLPEQNIYSNKGGNDEKMV